MRDLNRIAKVVRETLAADFNNVTITDVFVEEEVDADGDPLLRVEVIFEGTPKDLDAKKLSGAVRHIRPKLAEIGESAFPLLSFISKGEFDAERLKPA